MSPDDYWVEYRHGDWCVFHVSVDEPLAYFENRKKAWKFVEKEVARHVKPSCPKTDEEKAAS